MSKNTNNQSVEVEFKYRCPVCGDQWSLVFEDDHPCFDTIKKMDTERVTEMHCKGCEVKAPAEQTKIMNACMTAIDAIFNEPNAYNGRPKAIEKFFANFSELV